MHLYMHSSKIIKQKKIKFHAFLYAFFKKEQNQKFISKQISCILTCIFKKITFHAFVNAFFRKNK